MNSADYWAVRWELTEQIKLRFDESGFHIPFPQRELHVQNVADAPATQSTPPETKQDHEIKPLTTAPAEAPVTRPKPIQPRRVA